MLALSSRTRWTGTSFLALALAGLGAAQPASAQDSGETAQASPGDITVTARRREESLLSVPLAVSAINAEQLQRSQTVGLEDLAKTTPGLSFQSLGGTYQAPVIRGLAQVDQTAQVGNVGVFMDGIYLPNRSALEFDFMDLERVEVVKGPQSALYGRNTFSGAINYVSKPAILGKWSGSVSGEIGDYDRRSVQGSLNIPLGDIAAVRLFGGVGKFDGTIPNTRSGEHIGGYRKRSVYGASVLVEPTDRLRVRLFGMRKDVKETQAPLVYLPVSLNNCGSQSLGGTNGPRWTLICGDLPKVTEVAVEDRVALGLGGHTYVAYANAEYDLGFAMLAGTVGYTKSKLAQRNDQSTSPAAITMPLSAGSDLSQQAYLTFMDPYSKETSYDLRLTSNATGPLFWSVGGYIYDSLTISDATTYYATLADPSATVRWNGRTKDLATTGQAIFGQLSYEVLPRLKIGADGRYTHEKIDFSGSVTTSGMTTSAGIAGTQKYDYFTPRFTIDYDASDAVHFYANAARGYKTGGFNSNAYGLSQFEYGPETNWSYEMGVKGKLLGGRLVYAADVFYVDWKDIQTQMYIPSSQVSVVGNDLGATSRGVELDTTYYVTPLIWLRAAGAFLDPKYKKGTIDGEVTNYCGLLTGSSIAEPGCSNAVGGNTLARIARTQIAVTANVGIALGSTFEAYVRADYSYQSGKYSTSLNNDSQGKTQLVNARIGLSNENYELSFWVKNLFDVNYIARATVSLAGAAEGGVTSGVSQTRIYPGERRTIGLRGTYRF